MNIMFAEVQPSSANLSESAVDNDPGGGRFSDLMDKELNQNDGLSASVEYSQVSDINELNPNSTLTLQSDLVTETGTPAAWLEYLANQQIGATAGETAVPLAAEIVEADVANLAEETAVVSPGVINPAIGELLPGSGKPLPLAVNSQAESPVAVTAVPVSMLQKDLVRQAIPIDQSIDSTNTDTLKNSIANALNPDATGESAKQLKGGEFQTINHVVSDIADAASHNMRSHSSPLAMLNGIGQPANPLLPTQLETLTVSNTRDTAAWGSGIGERVHYMINQKLNTATVRLDPPMLGRLEVHIQINDDITNVTINTQHAQTRELIDNASFRLRDYLQENGYQNVNVDVSHQQESQQQASPQADDNPGEAPEDGLSAEASGNISEQQGNQYFSSDSVVDYFA